MHIGDTPPPQIGAQRLQLPPGCPGPGDGQLHCKAQHQPSPQTQLLLPAASWPTAALPQPCWGGGRQSTSPPQRPRRCWVVSFSTALASSDVAQMGNLQPVPPHRLPGPQRRLKQMGQNPAGAQTCLALRPGLGKRGEALQRITLPRCGTALRGACWPRMDGHRAASRGHAAPVSARVSAGTQGRGRRGDACGPAQGLFWNPCQPFWGMETQLFIQVFPEDRNDWTGGLLSRARRQILCCS